jgi:hypothetical protein
MNKVEHSADTGAPRIIIQANPSWDQWIEICEAVWVTALEGGCNYWMDRIDAGEHDIKDGVTCIKNVPIKVWHGADGHDYWMKGSIDNAEVTEGKSLDVVTVGINNLPPELKLSIMNPYTCDIDAEIADQIVQTGLFGSAVYG